MLNATQANAIDLADIASLSMAQATALATVSGLDAAHLAEANTVAASPIVLDLNGDGVRTVAAAEGVSFDLLANGEAGQYGWVDRQDALLVRDLNGDGVINDGTQLFRTAPRLASGEAPSPGLPGPLFYTYPRPREPNRFPVPSFGFEQTKQLQTTQ